MNNDINSEPSHSKLKNELPPLELSTEGCGLPIPEVVPLMQDFISGDSSEVVLSTITYEKPLGDSGRPRTGLIPRDSWIRSSTTALSERTISDLQAGVHVFTIDRELHELAASVVTKQTASGLWFPIDSLIVDMLASELASVGDMRNYLFSNQAIGLYSECNFVAGNTTDGMHFDPPAKQNIRVGLNVGNVKRRVHFVPIPKELLELELNSGFSQTEDYRDIAPLSLPVYGITVKPGQGWIMSTQRFLHDTVRLESGTSKVLLFRPEQN